MSRYLQRSGVLVVVLLLVWAPFLYAEPPNMNGEPAFTTDAGGQLFNHISWWPNGDFRVRCILGDIDGGIAFFEPQYTRGGTNVIYVSRPDFIPWFTMTGGNYDFYYPDAGFPFHDLVHGFNVRYQVGSVNDPPETFAEVSSMQDNHGPWIPTNTFQFPVSPSSSGDVQGFVDIIDWPAGVYHAGVLWDYGTGWEPSQPDDMPHVVNDTYSFTIPEPPSGWAGASLIIRIHGYDFAALPEDPSPSWWHNESYTDFYVNVGVSGLPKVVISATGAEGFDGSSEAGDTPKSRSTLFRLEWSPNDNFDPPVWSTDVTLPNTYGTITANGLSDGGRYYFRVGVEDQFGQFQFGEHAASVADYDKPELDDWDAEDLTESTIGPWIGSIQVADVELDYGEGGFAVAGLMDYRLGTGGVLQTINLVAGPGNPSTFSFSIPEPEGGWESVAGQSIVDMVIRVWDSATPPDGFWPNLEDNTSYYYPPDELIEAVKPSIEILEPEQGDVLEGQAWIKWIATDDQVPGGPDPDGDETDSLTILLSQRQRFGGWVDIAERPNSAAQPDSFLWNLSGLTESNSYSLRAIARDPAGHADTALVTPFTINVPDPPNITVIAPNGGEVILGDYDIRWTASDPDSAYGQPPLSLKIEGWYSLSGAPWDTIPWVSHLNDGEQNWDTSNLEDGDEYLVKLRATDLTDLWTEDQSDGFFTIDNNDPPDSVILIAPNGGEVWCDTATIRWYAHDPDVIDTLKIKLLFRRYDPEDPDFWRSVHPDEEYLENDGEYQWTIPYTAPDYYEMKVLAIDRGGFIVQDTTDSTFIINCPDNPTVDVIAPNGEEFWSGEQIIQWIADDPDLEFGDTLSVAIRVYNGTEWVLLESNLANTSSYVWDTDDPRFPDGGDYLVSVCVTDTFIGSTVCDTSDATFYVLNHNEPPSVDVIYPNGGESERDSVLVQWAASDPNEDGGDTLAIDLFYSSDGGGSWIAIASAQDLPNLGSWVWDMSLLADGNTYMVRVCATDVPGVIVCDESDTTFSIFNDPDNPDITLLSPNGGEHWAGLQTVEWDATDPDLFVGDTLSATVWVDSSDQSGFQGLLVAEGIPGVPGTYNWDTAAYGLPDGDWFRVRVRVTDTDGLSATDESDNTFLLFNNNDPPVISIMEPEQGDIWKGVETIEWEADDPDLQWGDTLAVSLYFRSGAEEDWILIDMGLSNIGERDWDTESVADGLTYQIRAVARDTAWAVGEDTSGVFAIENTNEPPAGFSLVSPLDGGTVTVFKPLMMWETARDIDAGDEVEYELLYTLEGDSERSAPAGMDTMFTDQEWPEALQDDSRYYWYVEATDSLGPATTRSNETWWFVTNVDGNDQPQTFHLSAPDSGVLVSPDSVFFSWTASFDEDVLDTVRYTIYLDTLLSLESATTISTDTLTSWQAAFSLLDNTTYYWAVLANDTNGAERWSEEIWPFTTDRGNDSPNAFHLLSPLPGSVFRLTEQDTLRLRWERAADPDPLDRVHYRAVICDSIHPADPSWEGFDYGYLVGDSTSLYLADTSVLGDDFQDNRIYSWTIYAIDSRGDTTQSAEQWWFATNDLNEAPLVFDLLSPVNGDTVSTLRPKLCWESALDPDPLDEMTYRLDHDVDPDFPTIRSDSGLTAICWEPNSPFTDRGSVYWRVYAKDKQGLLTRCRPEWWEFIILPQSLLEGLINYPNPFAAGSENTTIQYVLMKDADVELKVFDLLGNPVWNHTSAPGENGGRTGTNMIQWDGRNEKNQVVGNGGYLCLVRVSPLEHKTVERTRKIAVMK